MDRILSSAPHPKLKEFVRAYAQRQVNDIGEAAQPVVASLEQVLQFDFGDPLVVEYRDGRRMSTGRISMVGAHSSYRCSIRFCGQVESFGIFFQPFGPWQLFRLPNCEIIDQAIDGADLLGREVYRVWLQMAEAPSFEKRVEIVEAFLLRRAAIMMKQTPIMDAAMHQFRSRGMEKISTVADDCGLGLRQLERRFIADVGLSAKLFAKITRFQMALDAKLRDPCRPWIGIAHNFGYYDQMHMLHDFQDLGGAAPNCLLAHLGDTRPSALTTSDFDTSEDDF
jgi:AraC-like DNA-binding protein